MASFISREELKLMPALDGSGAEILMGEIQVDDDKCSNCGLCVQTCPGKALEFIGKSQVGMVHADPVPCVACGDCVAICEPQAISLVRPHRYGGFYKALHRGPATWPRRF